jgi:Holliday junction resolvase RusA-like endonuclease
MSLAIYFVVQGQPHGKGRPRASTRGGFVRLYTDLVTRNYEELVAKQSKAAMGDFELLTTPVAVRINAYFYVPISWTKKKRKQALEGAIVPGKPDLDNIAKSILDGIQNTVISDDRNVIKLTVEKRYAFQPRVEVHVYEVLP